MKCNFPVGAYRVDGSQSFRPCGMCIGCRLENARQWAVRCVHEAAMHESSSFVTLTYNDDNLPVDGSVDKKELSKFVRKLRKKIEPNKIRFFGCGEYGSRLSRPHYHICVFGYSFPDKEILHAGRYRFSGFAKKTYDNDYYTSELLNKVWKKGFHTIGDLTFESAGYVARYVTKKITGDKAKGHYNGKKPEFALMSRMPGIGKSWIEKYTNDVYPKDFHTIKGVKNRPNRYYDEQLKKINPKLYNQVKERRLLEQEKKCEKTGECIRQFQKEKYRQSVTKTLERNLEDATTGSK